MISGKLLLTFQEAGGHHLLELPIPTDVLSCPSVWLCLDIVGSTLLRSGHGSRYWLVGSWGEVNVWRGWGDGSGGDGSGGGGVDGTVSTNGLIPDALRQFRAGAHNIHKGKKEVLLKTILMYISFSVLFQLA